MKGIQEVKINHVSHTVKIHHDPSVVTIEKIRTVLKNAGSGHSDIDFAIRVSNAAFFHPSLLPLRPGVTLCTATHPIPLIACFLNLPYDNGVLMIGHTKLIVNADDVNEGDGL